MHPLTTPGPTLSLSQFETLRAVPPEAQWFANLESAQTRRAYRSDIAFFSLFVGITQPEDFRRITHTHVLAWRLELEK